MHIDIPKSMRLSCEQTAQLISLAHDHRIGSWRRAQIFFHNALCETCRSFAKFVNGVGGTLQKNNADEKIPQPTRERMRMHLKMHQDNDFSAK